MQIFPRQGILSLVPTQAQADDEAHRLELRRGQRQRAKEGRKLEGRASAAGVRQRREALSRVPGPIGLGSLRKHTGDETMAVSITRAVMG